MEIYGTTVLSDGYNHITIGQPFGAAINENYTSSPIVMGEGDYYWPALTVGTPVTAAGWNPTVNTAAAPIPLNSPVTTQADFFDCYFTTPSNGANPPMGYLQFTCLYYNASTNTQYSITSPPIYIDAPTVVPDPTGGYTPYLDYKTGTYNSNQTQIGTLEPTLINYGQGGQSGTVSLNFQYPNAVQLYGATDSNGQGSKRWLL